MSRRERSVSGVFSRILNHFGRTKVTQASVKPSTESQTLHPVEIHLDQAQVCKEQAASGCERPKDRAHRGKLNFVKGKDCSAVDELRINVAVPAFCDPCRQVVVECTPGSGGVQGLQWYSEKLMMDEDGDVAQEFLDEVILQASGPQAGYNTLFSGFKLKLKTIPAKLKGPVCTYDGNVVQSLQTMEPFSII